MISPVGAAGGLAKDPNFFSNDAFYQNGIKAYEQLIYGNIKDPSYMGLDCTQNSIISKSAAKRIALAYQSQKVDSEFVFPISDLEISLAFKKSAEICCYYSRSDLSSHVSLIADYQIGTNLGM